MFSILRMIVALAVLASSNLSIADNELNGKKADLKGLSLALSEKDLLKLFGGLKCLDRKGEMIADRTCVAGLGKGKIGKTFKTLGSADVKAYEINLINDKVTTISVYFQKSGFESVAAAFIEKYGPPHSPAKFSMKEILAVGQLVWTTKDLNLALYSSMLGQSDLSWVTLSSTSELEKVNERSSEKTKKDAENL